ncbi:uncharacterized protein MONBRDRAFT_32572 [Monosiga brevicollis MX1]|uniref:Yip1 domain-containing protein n=1 Tax=Monosiga brevicollis TaxID=81824 RepID=A9V0E0_MONBE|nr:uncharacterized protein MONBRDRAFT_32572 [Monosiga brevicollis MX1]EDQ88995.1 predicted protein [Monosiga brevicollis MX1]|eukprot:XP_001746100.1 hypothetical protein [Monosiga brevicollis MX1]
MAVHPQFTCFCPEHFPHYPYALLDSQLPTLSRTVPHSRPRPPARPPTVNPNVCRARNTFVDSNDHFCLTFQSLIHTTNTHTHALSLSLSNSLSLSLSNSLSLKLSQTLSNSLSLSLKLSLSLSLSLSNSLKLSLSVSVISLFFLSEQLVGGVDRGGWQWRGLVVCFIAISGSAMDFYSTGAADGDDNNVGGFDAYSSGGDYGQMGQANYGNSYGSQNSQQYYGDEEEPPLLEELGINFDHIRSKTLAVLNVAKPVDSHLMDDTDLAGPLMFCLLFGAFMLASGKLQFGYIYGVAVMGCLGLYMVLRLMSEHTLSLSTTASVLGYSLLPMVALSSISILLNLTGVVGLSLAATSIAWCTHSAARIFTSLANRTSDLPSTQSLVLLPSLPMPRPEPSQAASPSLCFMLSVFYVRVSVPQ